MRYGVYVHIPFCRRKCPYCDFVSFPGLGEDVISAYIESLAEEISYWSGFVDSPAYTIYMGGGTPSILSEDALVKVTDLLYSGFGHPEEFTIEANPEDLTQDNLILWSKLGINRISVGVQTTSERLLRLWGRQGGVPESLKALHGDFILNVDLIYPAYLPANWQYDVSPDIEFIERLMPHHVSWYILELHPGTRLAGWVGRGEWREVDEDTLLSDMKLIYGALRDLGYVHYEISNWALPGFRSKHNLGYWQGRSYIGLGLSASGFWGGMRWTNTPSIRDYLAGRWVDSFYRPTGGEVLVEIGAFALRMLKEGLSRDLWERYGGDFEELVRHASGVNGVRVLEDRILLEEDVDVLMVSNVIIGEVLSPWL